MTGAAMAKTDELAINGSVMPERIWLTDEGSGDICWANEPDPSGDGEAEAVAYVRADRIEQLEQALEVALFIAETLLSGYVSVTREAWSNSPRSPRRPQVRSAIP